MASKDFVGVFQDDLSNLESGESSPTRMAMISMKKSNWTQIRVSAIFLLVEGSFRLANRGFRCTKLCMHIVDRQNIYWACCMCVCVRVCVHACVCVLACSFVCVKM